MTLQHSQLLDPGDLLYRLYGMVESIGSKVKSVLEKNTIYVGKRATSATFKFVVVGVPTNQKMNNSQQLYFEAFTKAFVATYITDFIFAVNIQEQASQLEFPASSSLEVTGEIHGAQDNYLLDSAFAASVKSALQKGVCFRSRIDISGYASI